MSFTFILPFSFSAASNVLLNFRPAALAASVAFAFAFLFLSSLFSKLSLVITSSIFITSYSSFSANI